MSSKDIEGEGGEEGDIQEKLEGVEEQPVKIRKGEKGGGKGKKEEKGGGGEEEGEKEEGEGGGGGGGDEGKGKGKGKEKGKDKDINIDIDKKKKHIEEAKEDWEEEIVSLPETSFMAFKSTSEIGLEIPGVKHITISPEVQERLGCVIGFHVTSESPWIFVEKQAIDEELFLATESSDFLPIKDDFQDMKMTSILVGYDSAHEKQNKFYICVTETAKEAILQRLDEKKQEQQKRLENALEKTPREWTSLGSEAEVELFTIQDSRPYMRVFVETTTEKIHRSCNFTDRDVEDAKDGYYGFRRKDEPPDQIWCYRLDAGVQVKNHNGSNFVAYILSDWIGNHYICGQVILDLDTVKNRRVEAETQTRPYIPYNSWTQYEYKVDTEAPIEDEGVLKELTEFLQRVEEPILDILSYNEILDNYRDDYAKLAVSAEDTDLPPKNDFLEFLSFTDMKHCQGKAVSCVAFHPMWTGVVAIAYADQGHVDIPKNEKHERTGKEVYATHRVLVWSLNDAFNPKLILESPREVYSLAFAPQREELLVGGLSNGQIVIWDIKGKIERVETEVKLTPAQIRHKAAMINMMDWMKQTLHIQYLRPVAVSSLQSSHTDTVYELRFLHPSWSVTPIGQFEKIDGGNFTFVMSNSLDGTILVWNLDPENESGVSIAVRARKKKSAKRPDGLKSESSPYAVFHRTLAPCLKIDLPASAQKAEKEIRSFGLYIPSVQYVPDKEQWDKLTTKEKESSATRFKYLPDLTTSEDETLVGKAFIGTISGNILAVNWTKSSPRGTSTTQNLFVTLDYSTHIHGGPVLKVVHSPFIKDLYMTIDWDRFALWSGKLKNKPFLLRRAKEGKRYISGSWSTIHPMTLRLCCSDGSIESWDLKTRSDMYSILQSVSGKSLNIVENHPLPLPSNLLGVADSEGCFHLFFVPLRYQEVSEDCEQKMIEIVDREVTRIQKMEQWVAEWTRKNAELLEIKKTEEDRIREQEMKTLKVAITTKPEEEAKVSEQPHPKKSEKYGNTTNMALEDKRKNMLEMMMQKKRVDRDDLERKRAPLVQAQEAMQLKQMKLREAMRNKNTSFRENVNVIFPNVAEKPPPQLSDCDILAEELTEKQDSFMKDYRALEKIALAKLRKPEIIEKFDWYSVLQEGLERRNILDSELYHQTEWKDRAVERREQRKLHRESELRQEDEKRRKKKGIEMDTSSQLIGQTDSESMLFQEQDVEVSGSRVNTPATGSKISVKPKRSNKSQSSKIAVKKKEEERGDAVQQGESQFLLQPKERSKRAILK